MVEKRWRAACKTDNANQEEDPVKYSVFPVLPNDSQLANAFLDRKKRFIIIMFLDPSFLCLFTIS